MSILKNNQKSKALSQKEELENKYKSSLSNLLLVMAFTAINIVLLVTNADTYFLFSAFIPYLCVDTGMYLCGMYPGYAIYNNLEIKGGAAGGGYYLVQTFELDRKDKNSGTVVLAEDKVNWLVGEEK